MQANGKLPETSPLYAPCLKRRARAGGAAARYFVVPSKDVKAGYLPKTQTIPVGFTELQAAEACRKWWGELVVWRDASENPKAVSHTISWLIDRYLGDSFSGFRRIKEKSRRSYEQNCRAIQAAKGRVPLKAITGPDLLRWHDEFGHPEAVLGADGQQVMDAWSNPVTAPEHPQRQRHMIVMLRILAKHAILIDAPDAGRLRNLLSEIEFPVPKARDVAAHREQIEAFVVQAEKDGYLSQAITTLAQFELIERRIHIIGYWEGRGRDKTWRPGWEWANIDWRGPNATWRIRYFQTKVGLVLREFELTTVPALLRLLQAVPEAERWGAVVKAERIKNKAQRLPWNERHYAEVWREIARRAGIPDSICSMDMRASGATEADATLGVSDRALKDAGGWKDTKTSDRYRRDKQRNAGEVVKLRQAAKGTE